MSWSDGIWFVHTRGDESDVVERYEGDIEDHPGFEGFLHQFDHRGSIKLPREEYSIAMVLLGDTLYEAWKLIAGYDGTIPCTTNCRRAAGKHCQCSCRGRNHGKELEIHTAVLEGAADTPADLVV